MTAAHSAGPSPPDQPPSATAARKSSGGIFAVSGASASASSSATNVPPALAAYDHAAAPRTRVGAGVGPGPREVGRAARARVSATPPMLAPTASNDRPRGPRAAHPHGILGPAGPRAL